MCKKNNHTDWVRIPVFTKAIIEAPTSESSIQSAIPLYIQSHCKHSGS